MRSSNPVLTRLTPESQTGAAQRQGAYAQGSPYPSTVVTPEATGRMTIDDVVVRSVALLGITGITAALAWAIVPWSLTGVAWIGSMIIGLVLGLVISFKQSVNAGLILTYAVVEGVFVGMVSKAYEAAWSGIVVQAVVGTFAVFFVMAMLYRARAIRATPRFTKIIIGAMTAILVVLVVNLVLSLFGVNTGLYRNDDGTVSWFAILFSIAIIVVAALSFVLDFAMIEEGVQRGVPQKFAWYCAFGLLVGLVWLYISILRLLSQLRN